MFSTDLSKYDNSDYEPGNAILRVFWYFINALVFLNPLLPWSGIKVFLLRIFGAKVGKGVVIKPRINIKYPWYLEIGDFCWIGEEVWIDNLTQVKIGNNVCISQGAMLLTGNHNYKKPTFDLITQPIVLENGAWVGAKSVVLPGSCLRSHAVLAVGSVASGVLEAYSIYQGNPAQKVRERNMEHEG